MAEYTCPRCNRVFASTDEFRARNAYENHVKYCNLPRVHKILMYVLSPLGAAGIVAFFLGCLIYLALAPIAYPFIYSLKLIMDGEVYSWDKFQDDVYGTDRLKTFKRKSS
jgi:hypothetical protein